MENVEAIGGNASEAAPLDARGDGSADPQDEADEVDAVRAADALVRRALDFLIRLFPATSAHIGYVRKEDAPLLGGTTSTADAAGRFEDIRAVPGYETFLRVITVSVDERISEFLGKDAEAHLSAAYARLKIPVVLAQEWTREVPGDALREAREALRAQLPAHIIAHIIADQFAQATDDERYRFARHGEPQSAHDALASTMVESLDYMDALTHSRVEHQELSHGLLIAPPAEEPARPPQGHYPEDFRDLKRTSLLTDGYQSALWITPQGQAAAIVTRDTLGDVHSLLERDFGSLSFLAAASKEHGGIGMMLRPGGSVMAFASGQPLFIRRSGTWHGLLWEQIRSMMEARHGEVGAQLFGVALILATSSQGGILAIVRGEPDELNLNEKDRVDVARHLPGTEAPAPTYTAGDDEAAPPEWLLHRLMPAGNVLELSRPTLALLAGIDGATIVDEEGRLLSYGAIVKSRQGQSEGARTAAARTLSRHGLVIKVSEDGPVQIFEDGESMLTV